MSCVLDIDVKKKDIKLDTIHKIMKLGQHFVTSAKEVMFSEWFVCLFVFVSLHDCAKPTKNDCHETWRQGVEWAKEERSEFWSGSESPCGST